MTIMPIQFNKQLMEDLLLRDQRIQMMVMLQEIMAEETIGLLNLIHSEIWNGKNVLEEVMPIMHIQFNKYLTVDSLLQVTQFQTMVMSQEITERITGL